MLTKAFFSLRDFVTEDILPHMLTKAFFSLRDFVTEDILPHMLTKAFFPFATLLQKDIFHILLPKQISSLGTGSGPVPTFPPLSLRDPVLARNKS